MLHFILSIIKSHKSVEEVFNQNEAEKRFNTLIDQRNEKFHNYMR